MAKQGFRATIWIRDGGITGGSAEWIALGGARDCTLNTTMGEGDATHRAGGGFTMTLAILEDASVDAEILWIDDDAAQLVLEAAYASRGVVGVRMLDSDDDETGIGLEANCQVLNLTRREPLNDTIKADVTLKPTYSTTDPRWVEGLGESDAAVGSYEEIAGAGEAWADLDNAVSEGFGLATAAIDDGASKAARFTFEARETERSRVLLRIKANTSPGPFGSPYLSISGNLIGDIMVRPLDGTLQWYEIELTPVPTWRTLVAAGTAYIDITANSGAGGENVFGIDAVELRFA